MKPINIKISAFGPYKDEIFIDFTKFNGSGIFLITGDTGSGKTTIFDAISFALFGSASGSNREKNSFRSDFASVEVKTFVILEFVHKGITYKVERNPSYMRKKKRGEGLTQVSGDASIVYLDKVITGEKRVTDKCVEILGIDATQFKQISMIAQGEFLKLLLAKPGERVDIFRKIFDTFIYRDISVKLKKKYLDVKREYEDIGININVLKGNVIFDGDVNIEEYNLSDFLELVCQEICKDEEIRDKLENNKTKIDNKIQKITDSITIFSLINDNFDKYETKIKELDTLLIDKDDIDKKRLLVDKNKDIIDKVIPVYNEVLRIEKLIEDKTFELNKNVNLSKDIKIKYDNISVKYKELDIQRKKVDDLKLNLRELENKLPLFLEIDDLKKELEDKNNIYNLLRLEELNKIIKKFEANEVLRNKYLTEKDKFVEVRDKFNDMSNNYNLMYNKFISCQAGIIAADLKDGCPCPVCGSLEHPNKAVVDFDYITKEELDRKRESLDKCQKELEFVSNKVSVLSGELEVSDKDINGIDIDDINKKIEEYRSNIVNIVDISMYSINEVERDIGYIKASIDNKCSLVREGDSEDSIKEDIDNVKLEIEYILEYVEEVSSSYEKLVRDKASVESIIDVLEKEIKKDNQELDIKNKEYENSYRRLGYDSENEYLAVKLDKEVYSKYLEEIESYDVMVSEIKGQIKTLEEFVCGKERIDISKLENERNKVNGELAEIEMSLKNIHSRINNNKMVYDKLKIVYEKIKNCERNLVLYEDLSNTANGNIKGKNKLEFEQYVQASYFDDVLNSANVRFSYMTDSRYLLVRKVEATKVSDKLGLELEVMDNYTGRRREITSLSGGESFKASLALALGMSDVIQSYSGGVVVDTMFIDEGFGSLDSVSLESAMNAIMMLSDNNRLIGIISHVNELKDRIDKKIVVEKSNCGSSVRVIV